MYTLHEIEIETTLHWMKVQEVSSLSEISCTCMETCSYLPCFSSTPNHNVNLMYYLGITDTPNYSSGYSEQAKNFVSN